MKFPQPICATSSVLCETYENGISIAKLVDTSYTSSHMHKKEERKGKGGGEERDHGLTLSEFSNLKSQVARTGLEAILTMIFNHNFVHGDLHPG